MLIVGDSHNRPQECYLLHQKQSNTTKTAGDHKLLIKNDLLITPAIFTFRNKFKSKD